MSVSIQLWKRDAEIVKDLLYRLGVIEQSAQQLNDSRTVSWVQGNRALVYYYTNDFDRALAHQKRACTFLTEQTVGWEDLERQGVTHLLLATARAEEARDLERLSAAYPGWLTPIRRWPGGRVLFAVGHER